MNHYGTVIIAIGILMLTLAVFPSFPNNGTSNPNYPVAPFTVNGKYVVDGYGRKISMKGFQLSRYHLVTSSQYFVQADFAKMKSWGFYFVYSEDWWGSIETEGGSRDLNKLLRYSRFLEMARAENMYWIYRWRVCFDNVDPPSWHDYWCTHSYVCTEKGLARFCSFLEWAIQNLEQRYGDVICAYNMWQFPWHRGGYTSAEKTFYYSRVVPEMVKSARKYTDKPLIVSACACSPRDFDRMPKVNDNNVIYGFTYYNPQVHSGDPYDESVWGSQSDKDYQWEHIAEPADFTEKYSVPLNVVEMGIRIERQDQLDKLEYKLQILDHYDVSGWCVWAFGYRPNQSWEFCSGGNCKMKQLAVMQKYGGWLIG